MFRIAFVFRKFALNTLKNNSFGGARKTEHKTNN